MGNKFRRAATTAIPFIFNGIAEDRGYNEAPVSILMLDGKPPDMVFEKLNNTFAQRHHLRVWRRPPSFSGKPVWAVAATHDRLGSERIHGAHARRDEPGDDEDDEGDLGYAAAEDREANRKRVIVERLENVKSKNPVFTWC